MIGSSNDTSTNISNNKNSKTNNESDVTLSDNELTQPLSKNSRNSSKSDEEIDVPLEKKKKINH